MFAIGMLSHTVQECKMCVVPLLMPTCPCSKLCAIGIPITHAHWFETFAVLPRITHAYDTKPCVRPSGIANVSHQRTVCSLFFIAHTVFFRTACTLFYLLLYNFITPCNLLFELEILKYETCNSNSQHNGSPTNP